MFFLTPFLLPFQVGLAAMTWTFWLCVRFIFFHFWPALNPLANYKSAAGEPRTWAMITGATGGIGQGFAEELVERGFGVILVARNKDKLAAAAAHLKSMRPDAEVQTMACELTDFKVKDLEKLVSKTCGNDLAVTILINNVGHTCTTPQFKRFRDFTAADIDNAVNLNARLMAHLTRLMLPVLLRSSRYAIDGTPIAAATTIGASRRSLVINMSSQARFGVPYFAGYAPAKAFISTFSAVLAREFVSQGLSVDCVSILAGDVHTLTNTVAAAGSPTPRGFARMTLNRVDRAVGRGLTEISPYWGHALANSFISILPEWLLTRFLIREVEEKLAQLEKEE